LAGNGRGEIRLAANDLFPKIAHGEIRVLGERLAYQAATILSLLTLSEMD
jgi:hypothetical protein